MSMSARHVASPVPAPRPTPEAAAPASSTAPPPYPARRGNGLLSSFRHAGDGLLHAVVHQRNMRVHLVCAILVGLVGGGIPLGLAEKVTLLFCVMLIFFAEILNTALETLVDLAVQQFDEKARVVKDTAAAGVLVLAIGTVVVFAAILVANWEVVAAHRAAVARQAVLGVPMATCAAFLCADRVRPLALDLALGAAAFGLWATILVDTRSHVFSAMTLGLLVLCALAAHARRRIRRDSAAKI